MSYIGPAPTSGFISNAKERYTGITTAYVDLNHSISSLADVIVWVNYVKQDATNLTLTSSTRITLGATLVSADIVEVVYLGKAVATQNPSTNSITNGMMTDDPVGLAELSATGTASSSTFLRGDNAWASASADADDYFATSGLSSKDLGVGLHIKTADSGASVASGADELIVEGSADTGLSILSGTDANGSIMFGDSADNDGGRIQYNPNNDRMMFSTNGSERMRLKSNGLQLGDLNEALGATSSAHGLSCSGNGYASLRVRRGADTGDAVAFFGKSSNSTPVGGVSVSGTATSFNTSSDYRLKENEVAILDGITRLKTLKPYRFNFKADADTTVDGFFAHEVSSVVPEAISGEKDGEEMQAIDQSKLVPLLTSALQEAITKIETLEARVTTLEG